MLYWIASVVAAFLLLAYLRAPLVLELEEIPIATCRAGENPEPAMAREGERMLATLGPKDHVVALEVAGASARAQSRSRPPPAACVPCRS